MTKTTEYNVISDCLFGFGEKDEIIVFIFKTHKILTALYNFQSIYYVNV